LLLPGVGQICRGKTLEGSALLAFGAAELGTTIAVGQRHPDGYSHPGAAVPLIAFQDLWIYANTEPLIERALAQRALYTPQESLADMLAAPFNVQVLKRPEVWAGTLGLLALGIGASWLLEGHLIETDDAFGTPRLFGRNFDRATGYPLGVGVGVGLFGHVAIAEEVIFRGAMQSGLSRKYGPFQGWLWSSLAFGLAHSLNIFTLPESQRNRYLLYAVPFITGLGSYMGYAYHATDYSLSAPIAIHFWYDLLLSTTFFVIDPKNSPISASISLKF
jgi:membrane protease YdiL (CAAX protease family)